MIDQTVYQVRNLSMTKAGPWSGIERVIPDWVLSEKFLAHVADVYCQRRANEAGPSWRRFIGETIPPNLRSFQRLWITDDESISILWSTGIHFHLSRVMLKMQAKALGNILRVASRRSVSSRMSHIEQGKEILSPNHTKAAAAIFGCDPEWLATGRSSIAYCFAPEWYDQVSQEHPEWELGPAPSELKALGRTITNAITPADRTLIAHGKKFIADCIPGYKTGAPEWMDSLVLWGIAAEFKRPRKVSCAIPGLGSITDDCSDRQEALRDLQAAVSLPANLLPPWA